MPSPRPKVPGTPWWCVQDLENVKKTVEKNNRSIEQLEISFTGFQKQHQDWCSSVHNRCTSLEALCEQLSGSVQNLLRSSNQQHLRQEHSARIDQLFEQVHQERVKETIEFKERLERLEIKADQSLAVAGTAVAATDAEEAAEALDGTLAMLVDVKGSLKETQQAIAAACMEAGREAVATTSTMATGFQSAIVTPASPTVAQHDRAKSPLFATPREQRRASPDARCRESSSSSLYSTRATDAGTRLKKRPSRQAFLTHPMRQAVRNSGTQSSGQTNSVATLRNLNDSPRIPPAHSSR